MPQDIPPFGAGSNWRRVFMHTTRIGIISTFLAVTLLLISPAVASTIVVQPVEQGESTADWAFQVLLDNAQTGVAGYHLDIEAGGSEGSRITSVVFPEWAVLNQTGLLPAVNTSLKAVDLRGTVGPGARDVLLATVTVSGGNGQVPVLIIRSAMIEDDNSSDLVPDYPGMAGQASSAGASKNRTSGSSAGTAAPADTVNTHVASLPPNPSPGEQTPAQLQEMVTPPEEPTVPGDGQAVTSQTSPLSAGTTAAGLQEVKPTITAGDTQPLPVSPTPAPLPSLLTVAAAAAASGMAVTFRKN